MDKQFWISIKANDFAFPDDYAIELLTEELITYIGSTDPELRDTIGLEAFSHWLRQGLYGTEDLRGVIPRLLANIIAYENKKNLLAKEDIHTVLDAALAYFAAERDSRGYIYRGGKQPAIHYIT